MSQGEIVPGSLESVRAFYRSVLEPGRGQVVGAAELESSPDGSRCAFTAQVGLGLAGRPLQRVYLLELEEGAMKALAPADPGQQRLPRWSPDGRRLAYLGDGGGGPAAVLVISADGSAPARRMPLGGQSVEFLEWFPDGRRLLLLAAEEGASAGVLSGSGRVPSAAAERPKESWEPVVHRSDAGLTGWRRAFVIDSETGESRQISPEGINVWEGCLAGEELAAVVSAKPFEGDWVNSEVAVLSAEGGWRTVYRPRHQLGGIAASPSGARLAVLDGIASDRGLVAGEVVLVQPGEPPRRLELDGVDATWLCFRGPDRLVVAGVRDARIVFLELDLIGGERTLQLEHRGATSDPHYPTAALDPKGGLLVALAGWDQPPVLARAERGRVRELTPLAHAGSEWLRPRLGRIDEVSWTSSDGLAIGGLLVSPTEASGPQPAVLAVHGGPAALWWSSWPVPREMNLALLAAMGLSIFLPNPRGSSGRGQDFLGMEMGDYGGAETEDILTGIDALVAQGRLDPERLAVYGVSHGGYMACLLTTKTSRFRAAAAGSPVTDWYSQHFGSNIPDFDEMYLAANPLQPGGAYYERSPVFFAHRSKTPTLLSAGLQDRCTPPGQAEEFHQALAAAGVETELVIYPEEGHGIRQIPAMIDFGTRMSGLFSRRLQGGPASD